MTERKIRLGVAGLGRAFTLMLPTLISDPRVQLVAAADPRADARSRFASDFNARTFTTVEALCEDPAVEAVYIATPHQDHAMHVAVAASFGKHVLVEKPMALNLEDCQKMIAATRAAKVYLIVGHSHSFDRPIQRAREIVASGTVGNLRMITAINFTDFLYRPRRKEELVTDEGGGVVFSQAAHHVDIVRLLAGGRVKSVHAATGSWDPARPTEGAYSAFLTFEDGVFASITYSGYAHFDSDEFCGWTSELGKKKSPNTYGTARRMLQHVSTPDEESALKNARTYGGVSYAEPSVLNEESRLHDHFGMIIVSCDRADLRPLPTGVAIYGDVDQRLDALPPPVVPRAQVIDELYNALVLDKPPVHSGEWGLATMEVCLAILNSAKQEKPMIMEHQVGLPGSPRGSQEFLK